MQWWEKEGQNLLVTLKSNLESGLNKRQVRGLQKKYGSNTISTAKKVAPIGILISQFTDFMVIVLIAAAVMSLFIGEAADFYVIMAIVILNAVLGFIQEYQAERSLEALAKIAAPEAKVIREGRQLKIPAQELVIGDIVFVEAGDRVPADLRILELQALEVDEALLTGESNPVAKDYRPLTHGQLGVADLKNMLFMGTIVTRGRGKGIVVSIGTETEMGKIATLISTQKELKTPLERRLAELGKWLVVISTLVCALVAGAGWLRGESFYTMLMSGISLAVAAIPEGLPAIVTVALALGTRRMLAVNALIRRLPAVETLGCTTVICSDKTGTLTENEMTVKRLFTFDGEYAVSGEGYRGQGDILNSKGAKIDFRSSNTMQQLLRCGQICNTAYLDENSVQGDPTEIALLVLARKAKLQQNANILREFPFDSLKKRMSVVSKNAAGTSMVYVKGALEGILPLCSHYQLAGRQERMTSEAKSKILEMQDVFAQDALRVLACAGKMGNAKTESQADCDLIFYGLIGMLDPPRPEASKAVIKAQKAGIRTVMITGDHPVTAKKIAMELGIITAEDNVATGTELSSASEEKQKQLIQETNVFARVSPQEKLLIVRTLKKQGEVVAMTGDGVNDAPALKEADIGVAMGISGTDVSKEAAAMVLLDDNYATIVRAVHEGRAIYENIRKFLRYLLASNTGEVLTMFIAVLLGFPLPLLPVQILWVNLITDGLPAMALGVDPAEPLLMQRPPRSSKEGIFANGLAHKIFFQGILIAAATLGAFYSSLIYLQTSLGVARTIAFTVLVFTQLAFVFICRSEKRVSIGQLLTGNPYLLAAVSISLVIHLLVVYLPLLNPIFHTMPLNLNQCLLVLGFSLITFLPYIGKKSKVSAGFYKKK